MRGVAVVVVVEAQRRRLAEWMGVGVESLGSLVAAASLVAALERSMEPL